MEADRTEKIGLLLGLGKLGCLGSGRSTMAGCPIHYHQCVFNNYVNITFPENTSMVHNKTYHTNNSKYIQYNQHIFKISSTYSKYPQNILKISSISSESPQSPQNILRISSITSEYPQSPQNILRISSISPQSPHNILKTFQNIINIFKIYSTSLCW